MLTIQILIIIIFYLKKMLSCCHFGQCLCWLLVHEWRWFCSDSRLSSEYRGRISVSIGISCLPLLSFPRWHWLWANYLLRKRSCVLLILYSFEYWNQLSWRFVKYNQFNQENSVTEVRMSCLPLLSFFTLTLIVSEFFDEKMFMFVTFFFLFF